MTQLLHAILSKHKFVEFAWSLNLQLLERGVDTLSLS